MAAVVQKSEIGGASPTSDSADALRRSRESRLHVVRREGHGDLIVESAGRGEPLVLIHGWAVDRRMWQHQVPAFRRRFRTITYDRRGFGQTTCAAGLDQEVEDLEAILAHLKLARVAIVAMSQGGRIALRFASSHAERVSALVLQGAPLDGLVPPPAEQSVVPTMELAQMVRAGDRSALVRRLSEHALLDPGARFAQARAEIMAMLSDYRGEDLFAAPAAPVSFADTLGQLGRITAPTMVITGSEETLWLRGIADYTARSIRGARRRVIRGGRHFVNMTHIADYNRCVLDFLSRSTTPWSERASGSA